MRFPLRLTLGPRPGLVIAQKLFGAARRPLALSLDLSEFSVPAAGFQPSRRPVFLRRILPGMRRRLARFAPVAHRLCGSVGTLRCTTHALAT